MRVEGEQLWPREISMRACLALGIFGSGRWWVAGGVGEENQERSGGEEGWDGKRVEYSACRFCGGQTLRMRHTDTWGQMTVGVGVAHLSVGI